MLKKKYKLKPLFKHQLIITGVLVFLLVVGFFGGSYAVFMKTKPATEYNQFRVGDISLSYTDLREEGNTLVLNNDYPVSDGVGSTGSSYRFSVENNGTTPEKYYIVVSDDQAVIASDGCGDKLVNKNFIRYKFDNGEVGTLSDLYDEDLHGYLMFTGYLNPGESNIHEIRLWLSEESDNSVLGAHFHGKVNALLEQDVLRYKEEELNGADPVLTDNLIPVKISDTGVVTKADVSERWYSYNDKEWANAVVVKSNKKEKYTNANPETEISEEDIESYFVWIPRYKYKLFYKDDYNSVYDIDIPSTSNSQEIEIVFEKNNNSISNGVNRGDWLTHPAFTAFDVNGLWVGKFETTGFVDNLTIKPNQESLRNINIATMFTQSKNYLSVLDSHMMKNTEWGAVAYLSHSKYGKNGDLNINNNSNFLTGYGSVVEQTGYEIEGTYGTSEAITKNWISIYGQNASTTGNITGVYDMSGGTFEYTAGYIKNNAGVNSGFLEDPIASYGKKYFDSYQSGGEVSYDKMILGDATGEIGPFYTFFDRERNIKYPNSWYLDQSWFIDSSHQWFIRGGGYSHGTHGGIFAFSRSPAANQVGDYTFRIVLAPKE